MMDELAANRTPVVIASEINTMKRQMEKIFLIHTIEIGRRLKEVRTMLPNGEWGQWLEVSVNYSQRTAQRFITLFDAYGEYFPLSPAGGSSQNRAMLQGGEGIQTEEGRILPNLTSVQALILLGLPKEERVEFLMEMDVEGMSTRELKQAVEQRQEALQEAGQAVTERDQARQESADLRDDLDKEKDKNARLAEERDSLKAEIHDLERVKGKLEQEIENKKASYDKLKERTGYKAIKQMEAALNEAYGKAEANKIAFLYDSLFKNFKELAYEMTRFAGKNPELHIIYKEKIQDFLHNALREKL
ncbi:Protein of unknown function (DUF3102) [Desulfitobacterium dehalogenans ATCC 51507]|uniref:DUF3102 domain-containing protein n=1 Tax=Desulfitobacterium dehalogenans (strain ATCC 51507 / DSM 9161 / JW/IU-DC1) TaxID=756499 RepID=I4A4Y5_DESDJ|nr:DUF3102 domain-containing protein [Desulfitobacterium dehalogenans]AFL99019.1 Protein of unknown function (DUF3102) [Desulfitobacterium dehalogenans ATCC 51507]